MISMKKLRFSSHPSQSKSLAHGATGNCQRIALVSAVSLPQKSARSYLLGLNKFGVCSNFHCSFRCISKFWRSLPASFHVEWKWREPPVPCASEKQSPHSCMSLCVPLVSVFSRYSSNGEIAVCGLVQSCDVCVLEKLALGNIQPRPQGFSLKKGKALGTRLGNIGWSQIVSFSKITWRRTVT